MKITNQIRCLLDVPTRDWLDSIEQCGYEVHASSGTFMVFDGPEVKAILQPSAGFTRTWTADKPTEPRDHETASAAREDIIRWLEREHGCLYWPGGGVFLTEAQMAAYSREWQALFRELAERGWRISKCTEQSEKAGAFVVKCSGHGVDIRCGYIRHEELQWVVHRADPLAFSCSKYDCTAQEQIRTWAAEAESRQQGGAA